MPTARQTSGPKVIADCGITPIQHMANLELLLQELAGLEAIANKYFCDFWVGGQRRKWLLPPAETVHDLKPIHVDWILKNLEWVKKQLLKLQELEQDNITL